MNGFLTEKSEERELGFVWCPHMSVTDGSISFSPKKSPMRGTLLFSF